MINLISIPGDARNIEYSFHKIIHLDGFQDCYHGLFNEKGEGDSFGFTAGDNTKNWETIKYEYDDRFMGNNVYLQFWTKGEKSQFLIFEMYMTYFW